jgi:hypothetical protein
MSIPTTICIGRDDYHFEHVGTYGDGHQYMAYLTYADPKYFWTEEPAIDGQPVFKQHTNCFAVLHQFDAMGNYVGSDVRRVNGILESEEADWTKFEELIASLGPHEPCDILVKLFSIEFDGILHGLVYESDTYEEGKLSEWVMLYPRDIMFHPPWDSGEYST